MVARKQREGLFEISLVPLDKLADLQFRHISFESTNLLPITFQHSLQFLTALLGMNFSYCAANEVNFIKKRLGSTFLAYFFCQENYLSQGSELRVRRVNVSV
jgi:hypothetical protein